MVVTSHTHSVESTKGSLLGCSLLTAVGLRILSTGYHSIYQFLMS